MRKNKIISLFLILSLGLSSSAGYAATGKYCDCKECINIEQIKDVQRDENYKKLLKFAGKCIGIVCLAGSAYFCNRALKEVDTVKNRLAFCNSIWFGDCFLAYGFFDRSATTKAIANGFLGVVCLCCGMYNLFK